MAETPAQDDASDVIALPDAGDPLKLHLIRETFWFTVCHLTDLWTCPVSGKSLEKSNTVIVENPEGKTLAVMHFSVWDERRDAFIAGMRASKEAGKAPADYKVTLLDGRVLFGQPRKANKRKAKVIT